MAVRFTKMRPDLNKSSFSSVAPQWGGTRKVLRKLFSSSMASRFSVVITSDSLMVEVKIVATEQTHEQYLKHRQLSTITWKGS
jgi:hypothetical protein